MPLLGVRQPVNTMMMTAHNMREHRQNNLLKRIVELIEEGRGAVEILKVKSHTGIVGNERADELAVEVATTKAVQTPQEWHKDIPCSNNREEGYWVSRKEEDEEGRVRVTPLNNIQTDST